jgi:hypothetical protein
MFDIAFRCMANRPLAPTRSPAMRPFIIYLKDIIFIKKISYSWSAAMVI